MSRFVSGGTTEEPIERDEAWLKAQQEIDEKRRQKEEESRQQGGKSLYETLQANKAAKQDAFEESIRLSNQFRSLDEDEVEFLDSVLESTRAKESAVKKETAEQLELFRRQQEGTEKAARLAEAPTNVTKQEGETWSVKKRKRGPQKELPGVKLRKASSTASKAIERIDSETKQVTETARVQDGSRSQVHDPVPKPSPPAVSNDAQAAALPTPASQKSPPKSALGLADYSDSD
ncbi:hypothetical protein AAFC00_005443 [Neodothiora populina]|uniref:FAM192A/Fyv6 N-terminal domain-containing protein n=1 Tax=Neodothiora populina TaxID=2781224 RepID=A0ABR3PKY1_9PEZI